jgi:nucleoside-diphosphate-sugar epimerase
VSWQGIVIGASGIVGGHIVDQLVLAGEKPVVSRTRRAEQNVDWLQADLATPDRFAWPPVSTLYCTAHVGLLAGALPHLVTKNMSTPINPPGISEGCA